MGVFDHAEEATHMSAMPEFGDGTPDDQNAPVWCDKQDMPCVKNEGGETCGNC